MNRLRERHTIAKMATVLGVSRSGYYAWAKREPSRHSRTDAALTEAIRKIFTEHHKRYGSPRVREVLRSRGIRAGKKRVARLMQENGFLARPRRRFVRTTDSEHGQRVFENLLRRDFQAEQPGEKWVSDITYLRTSGNWLYLVVIIDLYDRKVIGWSIADNLETQGVCAALEMAVLNRPPLEGMLFHSDRGAQYCSDKFRRKFAEYCPKARQSMSRKGNCWDNACAESFFKTLKTELEVFDRKHTKREVGTAVFEYIEIYYNRQRIHSALHYTTPLAVVSEKTA
jgi:transposase InsO family protein